MIVVKEGPHGKHREALRRINYNETMMVRTQEKADRKIAQLKATNEELRAILADLEANSN